MLGNEIGFVLQLVALASFSVFDDTTAQIFPAILEKFPVFVEACMRTLLGERKTEIEQNQKKNKSLF